MNVPPEVVPPPVPPQPPRPGSRVVPIVVLVLALIILVCGMAVWTGLKFLCHNVRFQVAESAAGKKDVSIDTPIGSINVRRGVHEGSLNLPLYPGANRVEDKDSASIHLGFGDEANVGVQVAKFETSDPFEKVRAFYKQHLGTEVTKFVDKDAEGKTVFEIKSENQERVVALKSEGSKTVIELVHVSFGKNESN